MKELLLILVIAGISGYGYLVMKKLDHFLDENERQTKQAEGLEKNEQA